MVLRQGTVETFFTGEFVGCANPSHRMRADLKSPQEVFRAVFYEHYYEVYGAEFKKKPQKYSGDLSATVLSVTTSVHFDPIFIADCLDILIDCVRVTDEKVTIVQGSEQLATASALCCLHTLSHLTVMNRRVEDIHDRYAGIFPPKVDFSGLPFSHTLGAIHNVFYRSPRLRAALPTRTEKITLFESRTPEVQRVQWTDYKPSSNEHIIVARALAKLALFEYQRNGRKKVPRWLLRFAFHSLSQDPLPPTSAVVDCLLIIAIDLGCRVSHATISDEKYVHI